MTHNELEAKEKIIRATADLIEEGVAPDRITIRQIAERAGVGIGLINYHFGTKENLLNEAVISKMDMLAVDLITKAMNEETNPADALKEILIKTSGIAFEQPDLAKVSISHDLLHGRMDVASMLVPLIRKIFKDKKNETQIRLIALELITTLQLIFLRPEVFRIYSGYDISDHEQRAKMFDEYFESILYREPAAQEERE
jgi:AcrR family transcriptional regulator